MDPERSPHAQQAGLSIKWANVQRVLLIRLRSIGDTVLATPSIIALKRFLPQAQVDILLETRVAPILDGFDAVDNVLTVGNSFASRLSAARQIRRAKYDVVFNLHGGTTGTFFTAVSGARHRVGYSHYQYSFLFNHVLSSSADFWERPFTHSAEQQLALLGAVGVPVADRPKTRLVVTKTARNSVERILDAQAPADKSTRTGTGDFGRYALIHPAAAFGAKQWPVENFARAAEWLAEKGLTTIAVAARDEREVLTRLQAASKVPVLNFADLTLPEIIALASQAEIFVGNDSGIAHIAAAVGTPTVVIFGSSNVDHWRPWTDAPNEVVRQTVPCPGGRKHIASGELNCIRCISAEAVLKAVERVLGNKKKPA